MPLDLNQLAAGNISANGSSTPASTPSTIIVQNGQVQTPGGCLTCDDTQTCTVDPTNAVTIDYTKFKGTNAAKYRVTISNLTSGENTAIDRTLVLGLGLTSDSVPLFSPNVLAFTDPSSARNAFLTIGGSAPLTTNGHANAVDIQQVNQFTSSGAVVSQIMIQVVDDANGPNSTFANNDIQVVSFPIDPNDNPRNVIIYNSFCDACFSANNDGRITKRFSISAPTDIRQAIILTVPAGVNKAIFEVCYGLISIPNTASANALDQWV